LRGVQDSHTIPAMRSGSCAVTGAAPWCYVASAGEAVVPRRQRRSNGPWLLSRQGMRCFVKKRGAGVKRLSLYVTIAARCGGSGGTKRALTRGEQSRAPQPLNEGDPSRLERRSRSIDVTAQELILVSLRQVEAADATRFASRWEIPVGCVGNPRA